MISWEVAAKLFLVCHGDTCCKGRPLSKAILCYFSLQYDAYLQVISNKISVIKQIKSHEIIGFRGIKQSGNSNLK